MTPLSPHPVHPHQENRSLTLKLRKRKPDKKVEWSSDTVDNEHLGRRSSKCEWHWGHPCPLPRMPGSPLGTPVSPDTPPCPVSAPARLLYL